MPDIKLLRMRELTKAVGLPKSAILFYASKGLLPEPRRTGKNTALYEPATVERLLFIKELRERHLIPLAKVKELLERKERGEDVSAFVELHETIFGGAAEKVDFAEFSRLTGLGREQAETLSRAELLVPLEEGFFDKNDVEAGKIFAEGLKNGITLEEVSVYAACAKMIVDMEMNLRKRMTEGMAPEKNAEVTGRMVPSARFLRSYVIDRHFQKRAAGPK